MTFKCIFLNDFELYKPYFFPNSHYSSFRHVSSR